jgi:hypothetical protein
MDGRDPRVADARQTGAEGERVAAAVAAVDADASEHERSRFRSA